MNETAADKACHQLDEVDLQDKLKQCHAEEYECDALWLPELLKASKLTFAKHDRSATALAVVFITY
jgi:hypothetical protein